MTPEGELKAAIRSLLRTFGIFHWNSWGGPMSTKGVPDILGCHNGKLIGIEVKTPKGTVSEDQKRFIANLNEAGGNAFVARSVEDVINGLGLNDRFLDFGNDNKK